MSLYESAYGASIGDVIDDVTPLLTRLYDFKLVTSQSSKSSHSETRTRINCVDPLNTHYRRTLPLKISSFGLELWEKKHLARPQSYQNSTTLMT